MPPPIAFAKLSGSGNDHICVDNRDGRFEALLTQPERAAHFVRTLCQRGLGVGADGLIFAGLPANPSEADVAVRHFDPDGTEAELCGNGSACLVRWVIESGWVPGKEVRMETPSGVVRGRKDVAGYIHVCIPEPFDLRTDVPITAARRHWTLDYAVTGTPHVVAYVDDVGKVDVARWGAAIRRHGRFAPRGVNVNFTQVLGVGELAVRTFEFGVEAETLACGTGSTTAALMAARRFGWPRDFTCGSEPVRVHTRGGDVLKVYFLIEDDGSIVKVCLESVVRFLYNGTLHHELAARALD
ncbi:MAG TPA: diaminopimelate epimerase [Planctomycetota bacterium]|nr:diaminopimelate epimerase [Planctomycetota bacterium]HRR80797.1 diaminopimelate epimerase [Planctomycetota bacterium]HRT94043.1 diaminopimelate epimerase [Planctomycetota bacterium]